MADGRLLKSTHPAMSVDFRGCMFGSGGVIGLHFLRYIHQDDTCPPGDLTYCTYCNGWCILAHHTIVVVHQGCGTGDMYSLYISLGQHVACEIYL